MRETALLGAVIWILYFALSLLTFYVNHYLPHGPMFATGDVVCESDEQGPCGPEYKEGLSAVKIATWARVVREYWLLPWVGLALLGALVSGKMRLVD